MPTSAQPTASRVTDRGPSQGGGRIRTQMPARRQAAATAAGASPVARAVALR